MLSYYNHEDGKIKSSLELKEFFYYKMYFHELVHKFLYKWYPSKISKFLNMMWDILDNDISYIKSYIYYWSKNDYPLKAYGGGGKKGGSKTTIDYKWTFGLADVIAYEKPLITFEARLGNIILIGNDITTVAYIPCYWMKKYFYAKGYGYIKTYPYFELSLNY